MTQPTDPRAPGAPTDPSRQRACSGELISLCARRKRQACQERAERLTALLERLHATGVQVHNEVIARAELSVLNEVCKAAGLYFDLIAPEVRACVLIPATLYGDSGGRIFGKEPLQGRVRSAIKDSTLRELLRKLQRAQLQVIRYQSAPEQAGDQMSCLLHPEQGPREIAGVLGRDGQLLRQEGIYCGWPVSFEGELYLAFGYELQGERLSKVQELLEAHPRRAHRDAWKQLELDLLRTLIDPSDRHGRPVSGRVEGSFYGGRHRVSRKGLLLGARQALWRAFAEKAQGLTIHAHIAALVDDEEAREAFLSEVDEIVATQLLKQGGLSPDDAPLSLDELLSPFWCSGQGHLLMSEALSGHPLALLLLEDPVLEAMGIDRLRPIREARAWAESHPETPAAHRVRCALITYRTELNLAATYGACLRQPRVPLSAQPDDSFTLARTAAILPNLRALFDPRFMALSLAELPLSPTEAGRLERGLAAQGSDLQRHTLDAIEGDERSLRQLDQVGGQTIEEFRQALLELATLWRWRQAQLDPRHYLAPRAQPAPPADDSLLDDLSSLADLFDE
ncbi:hypothetical protein DL240_13330 [Lujinxingia litoralis]|uniref:Uncharacterized protein n=1 Tax=Lujinxingia litoralis TaxID=2211119 RepID=A0A328C6K1_9DELT|nr:hypothetical protein [Lujinxingia litoralis]RAL21827.1 hypothetical protein DL240_13330 [Lujinxingia litoralis]